MRLVIITFLLSVYSTLTLAQVHKGFRWIGPDRYVYSVNLESGVLTKESPRKMKTELGVIVNWNQIKDDLPGDFDVNVFYRPGTILITIPGTGLLYNLDLAARNLVRLDQTFFRGYNFNATQFFRNDTLFSIGGEGFWQKHSIITYYNPKTYEWDLYDSNSKNPFPSTVRFSGYSKKYDTFFSAHLETDTVLASKDIYFLTYTFKNRNWQTKGKLSREILEFSKMPYRSVWTGEYLILFIDKQNGNGDLRIINPFENVLYRFDVNNNHFFLSNCEIFYSNGFLYSRNNISTGRMDKFFFDSLSVEAVIKRSEKIGEVYETGYSSRLYVLGSIAIFLMVSGVFIYRKRSLKTRKLNLSDLELLVVKVLMERTDGYKISSIELNNILQLNQKSYDNQRQIRNRVIGTINQQLSAYLNSKELILRSSNNEDKRMMDYYINPEIKPKELSHLKMLLNDF
ncbi:MAG: hypothetical protein ACKOW2_02665 [Sphingobacteriaceae bacterium]